MRRFLTLILLAFTVSGALAQPKPRLWDEVQTIKAYDRQFAPTERPILFVGSSSIRKWDYLQVRFGKYNVLNRGIGGAIIEDIQLYLNDIVLPYKPRQIVIYIGENNVVNEKETAQEIFDKTRTLLSSIREKLPAVPILYISFKPSPSRDKFREKTVAVNKLVRDYLDTLPDAVFADVYTPMLDKAGKPRPELFVGDLLHMNLQGYAIWEKVIGKHLLKK